MGSLMQLHKKNLSKKNFTYFAFITPLPPAPIHHLGLLNQEHQFGHSENAIECNMN